MISSSDKVGLVRQSSLPDLGSLRDRSQSEGITGGGRSVKTGGKQDKLKLEGSDQSSKPTEQRLTRTRSMVVLGKSEGTQGKSGSVKLEKRESVIELDKSEKQDKAPSLLSKAKEKLAHGLKLLFDKRYPKEQYGLEKSGVRFTDSDKGKQIGPYIIVGDKSKGVEPGFMAKKAWMPKDEQNMLQNPQHKFFQRAHNLLDSRLTNDLTRSGPLEDRAFSFVLDKHTDAFFKHMTPEGEPSTLAEFLAAPENKPIREELLAHLKTDKAVVDDLRKDVMANEKKFSKLHFVKLDYVETDLKKTITGDTKVRIPADKQKFLLHREFTAQSRDSANRGAVREVIANDLMKELGIHSQKLKLVPTQYSDGHPKLLLDGTFATGPKGGKFSDFEGHLKDGYIVKLDENNEPIKKNGRFVLDTSINELGRNKIFMLAMADRDAIGSKGGNKGFADNTFIGIDPGHALEGDLLSKRGDIHSDFSFDQPSVIAKKGYKNFTIFDQQPLSEKMEGVRKLAQMKKDGSDVRMFDDYAKRFDGGEPMKMDYSQDINRMKSGWEGRRDDILKTFEKRLAVDNFRFQVGVGGSDPRQKDLANKTLDILDNLEKLTSKTSDLSPNKEVQLERPRVIERRAWDIQQRDNSAIEMSFTGSRKDARSVEAALRKFVADTPGLKEAMQNGEFDIRRDGNKVTFLIPPETGNAKCLETVAQLFTNEAVMQHKHG